MATFKAKLRRLAAKSMVALVGLVFGCVVAEIGLRLIDYSYPIFYQTEAVRGYTPIPELEGWSWPENKVYLKYNRDGFRDVDHEKQKPPGTIRIAVIGDSFSEARQVPFDAAFWSVLKRELTGSPALAGKPVEVLNFGVSGYGTVEELLLLRQKVWDYSPDIVLLAFCTYNDVTDNYQPFKNAGELPYFGVQNGTLVYDNSFLNSPKYRWHNSLLFRAWIAVHNHSRLIQLFHHAQFGFRTHLQAWKEQKRVAAANKALEEARSTQNAQPAAAVISDVVGIQNMIYRAPSDPDWNEAWRLTEALISQVNKEVSDHGAKLVVAAITADIQVYPDPAVRAAMMQQIGVSDLFYPDRRLAELADREHIVFVDLAEPMQAAADQGKVFFHGFDGNQGNGHWNEAGHRFAGTAIARTLEPLIGQPTQ